MHTLVIACGNTLRGDDGVAHIAADHIIQWRLPKVRVLTVHQLVPELIEEIQPTERVLFIDAAAHPCDAAFLVDVVRPLGSQRFIGHHETAANLLAMCHEFRGIPRSAWLLAIRAGSFKHGEGLSESTTQALTEALVWVREFLAEPSCTKSA
jgi:hydrogenase maturation protease